MNNLNAKPELRGVGFLGFEFEALNNAFFPNKHSKKVEAPRVAVQSIPIGAGIHEGLHGFSQTSVQVRGFRVSGPSASLPRHPLLF